MQKIEQTDPSNIELKNPHLVDGKYSIRDLIDIERLRKALEKFSLATGFTTGFLEYPSQEILIATGWRDICTKFHRASSESEKHCKKSNIYLSEQMRQLKELKIKPCENGLVDGATPIVIKGKYIAYLATGQVLFEEPDIERFKKQAEIYSYDVDAYLEALSKAPVVSEDKFKNALSFLSDLAVMIAETGLKNLELKEQTAKLEKEIIERKGAAEELRQSEENLSITLNSIGDAVIATDTEGHITRMNPIAEKLTGWSLSDAEGRPVIEVFNIINEETRQRVKSPVEKVMRKGVIVGLANHTVLISKEGSEFPITDSGAPIRDDQGKIIGVVLVFCDVTKKRQAEAALKEYSTRLEEMVEERTKKLRKAQEQLILKEKLSVLGQLAGGVGHELRNPLGVISNAVYYLKMVLPEADETVKEYLETISSEVKRSTIIVSDLLDLSHTKPAEREHIAVSELIYQTLDRYSPPEAIEVVTEILPELPPLFSDPNQIGQVFGNLVTNAYQAMPDGGKLIIQAKAQEKKVSISIMDTGYGISKENMEKLFEPLFTTKTRGIGLGLAVSKNMVEANGGSIEVKSEDGKGSTFTVNLPIK